MFKYRPIIVTLMCKLIPTVPNMWSNLDHSRKSSLWLHCAGVCKASRCTNHHSRFPPLLCCPFSSAESNEREKTLRNKNMSGLTVLCVCVCLYVGQSAKFLWAVVYQKHAVTLVDNWTGSFYCVSFAYAYVHVRVCGCVLF